ncbi:hypothetical protein TD95_001827 [Thielaviopsis punctulata]|uniref:C2H2-type domain-containing protein n=1 Tax=Thielaviopsis punctulata TaxID=72032 RepID=A0A0F4ZAD5_9PEZI|nr:hypothetical protein TD95_001827 [Thielaviopsis punctulata]
MATLEADAEPVAEAVTARSPATSLSDALSEADESDVPAAEPDSHTTDADARAARFKAFSLKPEPNVRDDTPTTLPHSPVAGAIEDEFLDGMSDVSDDTDGDIPSSPTNARFDDEDFLEQISLCSWEGCDAGDLGNMDRLVDHIHNEHIEGRQRKYTCEWIGCSRKSMAHASGYALKAHMRSHTREKPFYCYLPECDRAFTRSDALAKHMRTVHQTEDLRPSDPVPKSHQSSGSNGRKLKIILKTPASLGGAGSGPSPDDGSALDDSLIIDDADTDNFTPLSADDFTQEELDMPLDKLYRICRHEVKWAEEEGEALQRDVREMEAVYKMLWDEKELLLTKVIQSEKAWYARRKIVLAAEAAAQAEAEAEKTAAKKRLLEAEAAEDGRNAEAIAKRMKSVEVLEDDKDTDKMDTEEATSEVKEAAGEAVAAC